MTKVQREFHDTRPIIGDRPPREVPQRKYGPRDIDYAELSRVTSRPLEIDAMPRPMGPPGKVRVTP